MAKRHCHRIHQPNGTSDVLNQSRSLINWSSNSRTVVQAVTDRRRATELHNTTP